MSARTLGKWAQTVKGLYEKRGWFYFQPPTPKDAPPGTPRPKALALRTQSFAEAVAKIEDGHHDIVERRSARAGTMEELLPAYHRDKAGDTKNTRLCREHFLKGFMDMTGNPRVDQIDRPMIEAWRKRLLEKGKRGMPLSPATLETYSIALRAFLNWAVKQGHTQSNPLTGMKIRVGVTRVQDFLTEDERERLLAVKASEHIHLILHLGFFAGLRDGEMLAINPKWIWISEDQTRGSITVKNTPIVFRDGKAGMWYPSGSVRSQVRIAVPSGDNLGLPLCSSCKRLWLHHICPNG